VLRVANVKATKCLRLWDEVLPSDVDWKVMRHRFGFISELILKATCKISTQLGSVDVRYPMRRHFKSRIAGVNVNRIHKTFSTDTMFAKKESVAVGGETCCQVYVGNTSTLTAIYGMKREGEDLATLEQFVIEWGALDVIRTIAH